MKHKIIFVLSFLFFAHFSWSQSVAEKLNDAKVRQDNVLTQLNDNKNKLNNRNSSEIQSELTELNLDLIKEIKLNDEDGTNDDKIRQLEVKIDAIQSELNKVLALEQNRADLNAKLEEIGNDITVLQGLAELQEDKDEAARLREENNENLKDAFDDAKLALAQNVNGWLSLSGGLNSLHGTARNLIIFDEETNEKIGKVLLTGGTDILTIGFGALGVNAFVNNESTGQKFGFPALAIIGKIASNFLSKNRNAKKAFQGLTRNVVLGDVIYKNEKVTEALNENIQELHKVMFPYNAGMQIRDVHPIWEPKMEDIQALKKIVDDINILYLFLIDIRQAGRILLESDPEMTEDAKTSLEKLTSDISDAQLNWFKTRNIIQPYVKTVEDKLRSNGVQ